MSDDEFREHLLKLRDAAHSAPKEGAGTPRGVGINGLIGQHYIDALREAKKRGIEA